MIEVPGLKPETDGWGFESCGFSAWTGLRVCTYGRVIKVASVFRAEALGFRV